MADGFIFPNDAHPPWSLLIVLYPYLSGLVAGTFLVYAMSAVFRDAATRPVARLALVSSLCFCLVATMPLLLHLHHPERCLNIIATPNLASAMASFGFLYNAYLAVLLVQLWLVYRPFFTQQAQRRTGPWKWFYWLLALGVTEMTPGAARIDERLQRGLAILGVPLACVLTGYVGFLFGGVKANPWWRSTLLPVVFVVSAVASGLAIVLLLYLFSCRRRRAPVDVVCAGTLARRLWLFLTLALSLELLELLHRAYAAEGEWPILRALAFDRLAVSYVGLQCGLAAAALGVLACTFVARLGTRILVGMASFGALLVLVQVFAMRWNVVVGGQVLSRSFRGFINYPIHWLGREGVLATAGLLVLPFVVLWIAGRMLPLWSVEPPPSEARTPQPISQ